MKRLPAAAVALAALVPRARLHPAVVAELGRSSRRTRWAVALSGGADSLALLLLVWAHWPERRRGLVALHFNHRLRGRAAAADEKFCARACAALGIACVRGAWAEARRGASEAEARAARMRFFAGKSRLLLLGHQQDDIAESMLMRLARGSGAGGLAAPRPVQAQPAGRTHLRPLLNLKRAEIVAALRAVGVKWREDASNASGDFFRNRVRHRVVGAWQRAAQRDALAGAARARELLEEDDRALDAWLDELSPLARDRSLLLGRLAGKPRALARRALHLWLRENAGEAALSRQAFEALLADVVSGRETRHSFGTGAFAVIARGRLRRRAIGKSARSFRRRAN